MWIQELWSEFLLKLIRTPWILRFFFCVFLSPFVSFLWLHKRLQIGYGKFFRQNTTPFSGCGDFPENPCGLNLPFQSAGLPLPRERIRRAFWNTCEGSRSDCNQVGMPTFLTNPKNENFECCWMCERGNIQQEWMLTVCQWTEKSRDGKPMKQVCIGMDGQMLAICRAIPTYSCGDCLSADNSLYLSRRTCYDARNTECCMPECFSICSS